MLALTIRQPWAHAILHDGKNVEPIPATGRLGLWEWNGGAS